MARPKKETTETFNETVSVEVTNKPICPNDLEWTDHVLSLLSDDEKINDNPTTDGLRRIFEIALNCTILQSNSTVVQCPSRDNEMRATVVHNISYVLNEDKQAHESLNIRSISGSADVYWGNCDKIYRNHPVAVAETRAEGRALRRALKLRKVVAAEELAKDIEDHPDNNSINKITNNQINFIDVLSKRLDINVIKMIEKLGYETKNIYNIEYANGVEISKLLSSYQQDLTKLSVDIKGYDPNWK